MYTLVNQVSMLLVVVVSVLFTYQWARYLVSDIDKDPSQS